MINSYNRISNNKVNNNDPNFLITFLGFYEKVSGILTIDVDDEPLFSVLKTNNTNINDHIEFYIINSYKLSKKLNRPLVSYFPYTSFNFRTGIIRPETELIQRLQQEYSSSKVVWRLKPINEYDKGSPLFYYTKAANYARVICSIDELHEEKKEQKEQEEQEESCLYNLR